MAASTTQIVDLIKKLWARTQAGSLSWELFADGRTFQTRSGDFVVSLSGSPSPFGSVGGALGAMAMDVSMSVKRLDGRMIVNASSAEPSALQPFAINRVELPPASRNILAQMYNHLTNRDPDLDQLLSQL